MRPAAAVAIGLVVALTVACANSTRELAGPALEPSAATPVADSLMLVDSDAAHVADLLVDITSDHDAAAALPPGVRDAPNLGGRQVALPAGSQLVPHLETWVRDGGRGAMHATLRHDRGSDRVAVFVVHEAGRWWLLAITPD